MAGYDDDHMPFIPDGKKSISNCAPRVANTLESRGACARLKDAPPIAIPIARVSWFSNLGHFRVHLMSGTSMLDPRWRRLARLRLYSNASCIVAIALGCLVLCGWVFHNEFLKSGLLGSGPIEINTSLGLLFLGTSLWLLLPDPPRPARLHTGQLFAALVASLGTLTVVEYVSGLNLPIDQVGFRQNAGALATNHPGRMSPSTAATFFALGLALLLLDEEARPGRRPAQVLTFAGVFAAIMSLSGYINGASATFRVFSFTPVAVYVALVLAMMSVAILFARPRVGIAGDLTGRFPGSAMARRFLPRRDHRSDLRSLASDAGAASRLVRNPIGPLRKRGHQRLNFVPFGVAQRPSIE